MVKNKKKFQSVAIYSSIKSKKVTQIALQVKEVLEHLGIKIFVSNSSGFTKEFSVRTYSDKYIIKNCDLLIAIGGDGTLLSSARKFGINGIPVLGINLGNLGFLTDIAPEDLTNSLKEITSGRFVKEERFFLEAIINNKRHGNLALNEVVIHSGSIAQLIEYDLYINEEFVYRQKADGLIVSTPTGSTAYSLSGNGPIVHPKVKAITLLSMFPHSLNARPLLVDENTEIRLMLSKKEKAYLSLDSHKNLPLSVKDEVIIKKATSNLTLIHPLDHNFYSACRTKLSWSS